MIWHLSLVGYPNRNQFLSVLFFILAQHASRKLKVLKELCSCSPCEDRCKNGIVGRQRNHFKSETGINSQKINNSPGDVPHIQTNTITLEDDHLLRGLTSFEWFLNVRGYAKFALPDLDNHLPKPQIGRIFTSKSTLPKITPCPLVIFA